MSEYLKTIIDANIKTNGKQQITGSVLNQVLHEIVDEIDPLYQQNGNLDDRVSDNEVMIEDLQNTKIDKEADDYYPQLSVGTADNLSGVDEVDSEFSFRRSGGGAIADGVARVQSIKGNSVVWNQLNEKFYFTQDCTMACREGVAITKGHKYLLLRTQTNGGCYLLVKPDFYDYSLANGVLYKFFTSEIDCVSSGVMPTYPHIYCTAASGYVQIVNLTKMFGQGNEPTTIEEFNARIPMGIDLYSFNEGEVIDMNVQGIKSVGHNLFNEEWEIGGLNNSGQSVNEADNVRSSFIRLIGGKTYYFNLTDNNSYLKAFAYDDNYTLVAIVADMAAITPSKHFTFPSNATYIRFRVYKTDGITIASAPKIMLGIYEGEYCDYEPYQEASEDLSIVAKYFPNGMRSAGTAHDEIRYNKATQKWEKVQRIGEVDMGSLNWKNLDTPNEMFYLNMQEVEALNMAKYVNTYAPTNLMSSLYRSAPTFDITNIDKVFRGPFITAYSGYLTIKDTAYTDAASFKAAMQGVILYYELAEPIVTPIEEKDFNLDYSVWNCGTEQMVASKPSSALSADITYGFNAVGLIKQLRSMIEALSAKVANL